MTNAEKTMTPSPYAAQFNEIADQIEKHRERFDMRYWLDIPYEFADDLSRVGYEASEDILVDEGYCGTAACIGGTAEAIAAKDGKSLQEYLPLSSVQRLSLYYSDAVYPLLSVWEMYAAELGITEEAVADAELLATIDAEMAITMLRKLATGEWVFDA